MQEIKRKKELDILTRLSHTQQAKKSKRGYCLDEVMDEKISS